MASATACNRGDTWQHANGEDLRTHGLQMEWWSPHGKCSLETFQINF